MCYSDHHGRPNPATYELYATLPAQIAAQIGRAIVDDEFKPGQKLREIDLAQSFGVSRASVREALRMVESEGLVTILPQRGAQVTALSVEEVQDVFDIRANLMGLACQRLAAKATAETHRRLSELLKDLRAARDDGDAYARAATAISEYCVRNAGSKRLADLILSFGRQTARYSSSASPRQSDAVSPSGAGVRLLRPLPTATCRQPNGWLGSWYWKPATPPSRCFPPPRLPRGAVSDILILLCCGAASSLAC